MKMKTHLQICVRAFCDEHEMLQVLHDGHIICDLQMFPVHELKASSQQLWFNYLASKKSHSIVHAMTQLVKFFSCLEYQKSTV